MKQNKFKKIQNNHGKITLKIIFQTIGTFVIVFLISLTLVLLLTPGKFKEKLNSIGDYALKVVGIKHEERIEDNPLDESFKNNNTKADTGISNDPGQIQTKIEQKQRENLPVTPKPQPKLQPQMASGIYYSQLNSIAKKIYDKLSAESAYFLEGEHSFNFGEQFSDLINSPGGTDKLNEAFQASVNALVLDYPQLFFIDVRHISLSVSSRKYPSMQPVNTTIISNAKGKKYYIDGLYTKEDVNKARKEMEDIRNTIISKANTFQKPYQKIQYVHDYLIQTVSYEENDPGDLKHNMYAALKYRRAVCEGYAKAFKYILDGMGFNTITVVGRGIGDGRDEAHAWNMVYLDGQWYGVDVTFDDPIVKGGGTVPRSRQLKFFLVGKREFAGNHIEDGIITPGISFKYPQLSNSRYNLY